jgi:hypothetical protein
MPTLLKLPMSGPLRDGVIAGSVVALAYILFFSACLVIGVDFEPFFAVVQVVMQSLGFGTLVGVGSWLVRRLW